MKFLLAAASRVLGGTPVLVRTCCRPSAWHQTVQQRGISTSLLIASPSPSNGTVVTNFSMDSQPVKTKRQPGDGEDSRVVVITSGKGGVGKTTTAASFAYGLAERGFKVCAIDFDIGLRNLDLHLGCERRVVFDFVQVLHGEAQLHQALIKDKRYPNLQLLAASQTRDKSALTVEGVWKVIEDLKKQFEFIVCDSPAGIEQGAAHAMHFADDAILCTNPELSSVRDSDKMIGLIQSKSHRGINNLDPVKQYLLVTRYEPQRVETHNMISVQDIQEMLGIPLVGVVPESDDVLEYTNVGQPIILSKEKKIDVGEAYEDFVARFCGEQREWRFLTAKKKGFFSKMFG